MAYETLEPMGNVEANYMAGMVCAMIVSTVQSIFSKSRRKVSPLDFIPDWHPEEEEGETEEAESTRKRVDADNVDEMKALFQQLAKAYGKSKRKGSMVGKDPPLKRVRKK